MTSIPGSSQESTAFSTAKELLYHSISSDELPDYIMSLIAHTPSKSHYGEQRNDIKNLMISLAIKKVDKKLHPQWIKRVITKHNRLYYQHTFTTDINENDFCTCLRNQILSGTSKSKLSINPNIATLSNALHIACQWNHPDAIELISLLVQLFPYMLEEENAFGCTPFYYLLNSEKIERTLNEVILKSNHPNTPENLSESSSTICHYHWLKTLLLSENRTLVAEYLRKRPWSIVSIDLTFDGNHFPHPLVYIHIPYQDSPLYSCNESLRTVIGAIWDELMMPHAGICFETVLMLALNEPPNIIEDNIHEPSHQQTDWLSTHPLFVHHFPEAIYYIKPSYFNIASMIDGLKFWKNFAIDFEAQIGAALNDRNKLYEHIALIILYKKREKEAIIHLKHLLQYLISIDENIHITFVENFLFAVDKFYNLGYNTHKEFAEHIACTILDLYFNEYQTNSIYEVLPLFRLIQDNKNLRDHYLNKFVGINTTFFFADLTRELLSSKYPSIPSLKFEILDIVKELGLLNAPQHFTHINPLSNLVYNNHPNSVKCLDWVINNLPWMKEFIDFPSQAKTVSIPKENIVDTTFHLFNVTDVPYTDLLDEKICMLFPFASILKPLVLISLLRNKISKPMLFHIMNYIQNKKHLIKSILKKIPLSKKEYRLRSREISYKNLVNNVYELTVNFPNDQIINCLKKNLQSIKSIDQYQLCDNFKKILDVFPKLDEWQVEALNQVAQRYNLTFEVQKYPDIPVGKVDMYLCESTGLVHFNFQSMKPKKIEFEITSFQHSLHKLNFYITSDIVKLKVLDQFFIANPNIKVFTIEENLFTQQHPTENEDELTQMAMDESTAIIMSNSSCYWIFHGNGRLPLIYVVINFLDTNSIFTIMDELRIVSTQEQCEMIGRFLIKTPLNKFHNSSLPTRCNEALRIIKQEKINYHGIVNKRRIALSPGNENILHIMFPSFLIVAISLYIAKKRNDWEQSSTTDRVEIEETINSFMHYYKYLLCTQIKSIDLMNKVKPNRRPLILKLTSSHQRYLEKLSNTHARKSETEGILKNFKEPPELIALKNRIAYCKMELAKQEYHFSMIPSSEPSTSSSSEPDRTTFIKLLHDIQPIKDQRNQRLYRAKSMITKASSQDGLDAMITNDLITSMSTLYMSSPIKQQEQALKQKIKELQKEINHHLDEPIPTSIDKEYNKYLLDEAMFTYYPNDTKKLMIPTTKGLLMILQLMANV